jgi:hypothetical protein
MSDTNTSKRSPIVKAAILISVLFIILAVAWFAMRFIGSMPNALGSLASITSGVNSSQEPTTNFEPDPVLPIAVATDTTILENGESVVVSWDAEPNGEYVFVYACDPGITLSHDSQGGLTEIDCNTDYSIGAGSEISLIAESTESRYTDVQYKIGFVDTDSSDVIAEGSGVFTVMNINITDSIGATEGGTSDEVSGATTNDDTTEVSTNDVPAEGPATHNSAPSAPAVTQQFEFSIPVSNPNGFVDLAATYGSVGTIVNRTFVPTTIERDNPDAVQFAVQNFGSKTSDTWTYVASLPDGTTYRSPAQDPLKPNERAMISLSFDRTATPFTVTVTTTTDEDLFNNNDSFTRVIR